VGHPQLAGAVALLGSDRRHDLRAVAPNGLHSRREDDLDPVLLERGLQDSGSLLVRSGRDPVGRLDADSEGLLLLTNDGAWAERVLHPRFGHEREYEVDVEPEPTAEQLSALRRGVRLEEGIGTLYALRLVATSRLRLVLRTGWKRQVRRMCAAVGLRVTRLRRVRMGPLTLGALPLGKWRELTKREITSLRAARTGFAGPRRAPFK